MDPRRIRKQASRDASSSPSSPSPQGWYPSGTPPQPAPKAGSSQEALPSSFASAGEWLCSISHKELVEQQTPEAIAARVFLQMQGLAWSAIDELPVGVLGDVSRVRMAYRDQRLGPVEAIEYWLNDPRLNRVLMGPIRDSDARLATLWARSIELGQRNVLYRHAWKEQIRVYGRESLSTVGPGPVFVVEKILDALVLRSHGIEPALALGRRFDEIPAETWAALCSEIASSIVLIPAGSNVPASVFRTVRVHVERLINPPELWVLPPKRMFAPLGRMAAVLKASEFIEYVRHRGVALLGRRRIIELVKGTGQIDPHHSCPREGRAGIPAQDSPNRSDGIHSEKPHVPNRSGNVDWLAFD